MSLVTVNGNVLPFTEGKLGKRTTFNTGTIRLALVMPPRCDQVPVDLATGLPARVHYDVAVRWNGEFEFEVRPNSAIKPAGTVYSFALMIPNVNATPMFYSFRGAGPFNLNAMNPIKDFELNALRASEIRDQIARLQQQMQELKGHHG